MQPDQWTLRESATSHITPSRPGGLMSCVLSHALTHIAPPAILAQGRAGLGVAQRVVVKNASGESLVDGRRCAVKRLFEVAVTMISSKLGAIRPSCLAS